jgi:catalase
VPCSASFSDAGSLAERLVLDLERACPAHVRGTRPIHAPGVAATGWFCATPSASTFTTATHFGGARIPATVRFSNGTGDAAAADAGPLVRGMAVKFHLGEVTTDETGGLHSETETDLVAMSLPMFFVDRVSRFQEFVRAATAVRPKRRSWRQGLIERVRLDTPYPTPPPDVPSSDQGLFDFAVAYPPARVAVAYLAAKFVPESYTTCSFHAVHAYRLTAPDGATRSVRFRWEPVDGVQSALPGARGNFLRGGLAQWIRNGRAEFVLRIQLAEQGDDTADPMRPWPSRRPLVVMGHLRLTAVSEDQYHGCELLSFNPTRVVPGMGLSADPILALRGEVYDRSFQRRLEASEATASPAPR